MKLALLAIPTAILFAVCGCDRTASGDMSASDTDVDIELGPIEAEPTYASNDTVVVALRWFYGGANDVSDLERTLPSLLENTQPALFNEQHFIPLAPTRTHIDATAVRFEGEVRLPTAAWAQGCWQAEYAGLTGASEIRCVNQRPMANESN